MDEAAAYCECGLVRLTEKSSMEELSHIGLITDIETQQIYLKKFGADLDFSADYQVFVSEKHGNGSGHYKIDKLAVDGQNITLSLGFSRNPFEMGATVINQRILFFEVGSDCEIVDVSLLR